MADFRSFLKTGNDLLVKPFLPDIVSSFHQGYRVMVTGGYATGKS